MNSCMIFFNKTYLDGLSETQKVHRMPQFEKLAIIALSACVTDDLGGPASTISMRNMRIKVSLRSI